MTTTQTAEQAEDLVRQLSVAQAAAAEAEALIRFLRERGVILNNEVRHRDARISRLEQAVASLTEQLVAAERSVQGEATADGESPEGHA